MKLIVVPFSNYVPSTSETTSHSLNQFLRISPLTYRSPSHSLNLISTLIASFLRFPFSNIPRCFDLLYQCLLFPFHQSMLLLLSNASLMSIFSTPASFVYSSLFHLLPLLHYQCQCLCALLDSLSPQSFFHLNSNIYPNARSL